MGEFYGKSIVSVNQYTTSDLDAIFDAAHDMRQMVGISGSTNALSGKVLANLFYEPSTRTSSSFAAAMMRLGGSVISINEVSYSSVSKGETLEDTIKTLECYADVIALRHPEIGAALRASDVASKPIINAGDGTGEHPTQALLDLYTIREELGDIDGLTVTLLGDLKHGRTVHSLAQLLSHYNVNVNYVSPPQLMMPEHLVSLLDSRGLSQSPFHDLNEVLSETDVLYVTRVQK